MAGEKHSATARTARRSLSLVLLALHLFLFVVGGSLLGARPAQAAPSETAIASAAGYGDGSSIVATSRSRHELGSRPRARGERGPSGASLHALSTAGAPAIGPASSTRSCEAQPASLEVRRLPCVVNGPRGPPSAR